MVRGGREKVDSRFRGNDEEEGGDDGKGAGMREEGRTLTPALSQDGRGGMARPFVLRQAQEKLRVSGWGMDSRLRGNDDGVGGTAGWRCGRH